MNFVKVMEVLSKRFQSGNSVPVESARITKEEFETIENELERLIMVEESNLNKNVEK